VVQNLDFLELCVQILNMAPPYPDILVLDLGILAPTSQNHVFSRWRRGGGLGLGSSGRFRHRCRENVFRPPLVNLSFGAITSPNRIAEKEDRKSKGSQNTPPRNWATLELRMCVWKMNTRCKLKNSPDTARSVEDETRNGHRNAKRNPNRNHETIVLGLFSFENLKRDEEW